jgi:hypothetical protein
VVRRRIVSRRDQILAMLAELERHPDVELQRAHVGTGASPAAIARAESTLGRKLTADLRAFYAEVDGLDVRWQHRDDRWRSFGARGSIRIIDIASLRWFGDHVAIDFPYDEHFLGLARESDTFAFVHETDGDARAFTKRFADYLDALLEARGWSYWQQMYLYDPRTPRYTVEETQGRMQAILPRLFPGFEITRVGRAAHCPQADISELLRRPRVIAYRLRDLPTAFVADLPPTSPLFDKTFFVSPATSSLTDDLFAAIPEDDLHDNEAGLRIATDIGNAASSTYCFTDLIAPEENAGGGRRSLRTKSGFHAADAATVEAWLRERAELVPISALFANIAFFTVRATHGALDAVEVTKSYNTFKRDRMTAIGRGIFVVDRTDTTTLRLFHHPGGLRFEGATRGPGEEYLELAVADLPVGVVTPLSLTATAVPTPTERWIALGDLPARFAALLPASSPFVFWLAPIGSPLARALRELPEPQITGASAAFRICDELEAAAEPWRLANNERRLEAGFHADRAAVEDYLRSAGARIVLLADVLA